MHGTWLTLNQLIVFLIVEDLSVLLNSVQFLTT